MANRIAGGAFLSLKWASGLSDSTLRLTAKTLDVFTKDIVMESTDRQTSSTVCQSWQISSWPEKPNKRNANLSRSPNEGTTTVLIALLQRPFYSQVYRPLYICVGITAAAVEESTPDIHSPLPLRWGVTWVCRGRPDVFCCL